LEEANIKESDFNFVRNYTYEQMFFAMNDLFGQLSKEKAIKN